MVTSIDTACQKAYTIAPAISREGTTIIGELPHDGQWRMKVFAGGIVIVADASGKHEPRIIRGGKMEIFNIDSSA